MPETRSTGIRVKTALASLAAVLACLILPLVAEARLGGGQSYSGGSSSSSSSSYSSSSYSGGSSGGWSSSNYSYDSSSGSSGGGGGSGADGGIVGFIFLGMFLIFVVISVFARVADSVEHVRRNPAPPRPRRQSSGIEKLKAEDPNFSEPLFLDFVCALYNRTHESRGRGELDNLTPYLGRRALKTLRSLKSTQTLSDIKGVIVGAASIQKVKYGSVAAITVVVESNYTEVHKAGGTTREDTLYCKELWTFTRKRHVLSLPPETRGRADLSQVWKRSRTNRRRSLPALQRPRRARSLPVVRVPYHGAGTRVSRAVADERRSRGRHELSHASQRDLPTATGAI